MNSLPGFNANYNAGVNAKCLNYMFNHKKNACKIMSKFTHNAK